MNDYQFTPSLNPKGEPLRTRRVAEDVFALCAQRIPLNNSAFFVGTECVLVVDSLVCRDRAIEIQRLVNEITDKPISYLVNTNFHGDHTFGNCFFPTSCQIVSHFFSASLMTDFDSEKSFMLKAVNNDSALFEDVVWRLPDITFQNYFEIDIGRKKIELHHFGKGNSKGDIVVYDRITKTLCTGNLIVGEGLIPYVIDGDVNSYIDTITLLTKRLDILSVIPGHGKLCDKQEIHRQLKYLERLRQLIGIEHSTSFDENKETFDLINSYKNYSRDIDLLNNMIHASNLQAGINFSKDNLTTKST